MENNKSLFVIIREWASANSEAFIAALIPIITGLIAIIWGFCRREYWRAYYAEFNIDYKYVSLNDYENLTIIIFGYLTIYIYLMIILYVIRSGINAFDNVTRFIKIKKDSYVSKEVKKYLWKVIIKKCLLNVFGICMCSIPETFFNVIIVQYLDFKYIELFYDKSISVFILKLYANTIFFNIVLCIIIICIIQFVSKHSTEGDQSIEEKIYNRIFTNNEHDDSFKVHQIEALKTIITPDKNSIFTKGFLTLQKAIFPLEVICVISFTMIMGAGLGQEKAISQRVFLVTQDNQHVAIPVSADRYALIDMEEDNGCLKLFTGKQNFHEINDFPCTEKEYQDVIIYY